MVSRDHKLSMRKQCELLQLSRSRLYYQPVGESAENLRFMEIIDKQFLETVARVAPSVRARWATVWIASDGPVHEAQQSPMWPPRIRRLMRLMRLAPIYQEPNTTERLPADAGRFPFCM